MTAGAGRPRGPRVLVAAGLLLAVTGVGLGLDSRADPVTDAGAGRDATGETVVWPGAAIAAAGPVASPRGRDPGPTLAVGPPQRLEIPRLDVSSAVLPVRAEGETLVPPSDPAVTGWWSDGVRPGARHGAALLTGHTVHDGGGALDHLESLEVGDPLRVRWRSGVLHYAVTAVSVHSKAEFADRAARVLRQEGPHRLVVVTCEDWDGSDYRSNVVVQATLTDVRASGDRR